MLLWMLKFFIITIAKPLQKVKCILVRMKKSGKNYKMKEYSPISKKAHIFLVD